MTILPVVFTDQKFRNTPAKLFLAQPTSRIVTLETDKLLTQFQTKQVQFKAQGTTIYVLDKEKLMFQLAANDMLQLYRALRNFNTALRAKLNGHDVILAILPRVLMIDSASEHAILHLSDQFRVAKMLQVLTLFFSQSTIELVFADKATTTTAFNLLKLASSATIIRMPLETRNLKDMFKRNNKRDAANQVAEADFMPKNGEELLEPQSFFYHKGRSQLVSSLRHKDDSKMAKTDKLDQTEKAPASAVQSTNTSTLSSTSKAKRHKAKADQNQGNCVSQSKQNSRIQDTDDRQADSKTQRSFTQNQAALESESVVELPASLPALQATNTVEHRITSEAGFQSAAQAERQLNQPENKLADELTYDAEDAVGNSISHQGYDLASAPTQQFIPQFAADEAINAPILPQNPPHELQDNQSPDALLSPAAPALPDVHDDVFEQFDFPEQESANQHQ